MATKDTPKKLYRSAERKLSSCRLCNAVADNNYCKNLYKPSNQSILKNAEEIYGKILPQNENLPHNICRACERRIMNTMNFKRKIVETQNALAQSLRTKRCVEISPSVIKPPRKVRASEEGSTSGRRKSLDFVDLTDSLTSNSEGVTGISTLIPFQINAAQDFIEKANNELTEIARRSEPSVLRKTGYDGMCEEHWMSEVSNELSTRCPTVKYVLFELLDGQYNFDKKIAAICLIYGIIMFLRCHEMSRLQRINTVLLTQGHASTDLMDRLNKFGFCLDPSKKYKVLDEIGKNFIDNAIALVKSGYKFVFVLDNIDWEERAHDIRKDNQNKMVHAVATSLVFNRVSCGELPDCGPQKDLKACNVRQVVSVTNTEWEIIRSRYRIILAKLLFDEFPEFQAFKAFIPQRTDCLYDTQTSLKSEIVTMPILLKDEKKYSECVDILDKLEEWTHEIYSGAGLCKDSPTSDDAPVIEIGTRSRPDQPASHIHPSSSTDDPLCGVQIPCFGDQLTRVRLAGAKDLRAGCHSARQRLDHLYPFCIVDWHTKRSYLKTVFKRLYKNSNREKGTLRYFREKLNRRNVTVDVKHFEDCEQLFLSVGKSYVIEAFLEFFNMANPNQKPSQNSPYHTPLITDAQKQSYITIIIDQFIDKYIFVDKTPQFSNDEICCYAVNLLKSFMVLADMKDAVSTGNGEHLSTLRKQLLPHFFSASGFNEYAIEMLVNIMQTQILLSESDAHQCKWAATVNWNGGQDKNIEIDLFQENRNSDMKTLIRAMGVNKTEKAITRASKASGGVKKIVESFDKQVNIRRRSSIHSHKSTAQDEVSIRADLRSVRPFKCLNGRALESFPKISHNPVASLNEGKFQAWIDRHKKNILLHFPASEDGDESNE